jgi:hypothetical protein
MLLKGEVHGIRPVSGEYTEGNKTGEKWYFLSLEVKDTLPAGEIYSCQLRDDDPAFKEYVDITGAEPKLLKDLKGHTIKALVVKVAPGARNLRRQVMDKDAEKGMGYKEQVVPVVRCHITGIVDEGLPAVNDVKW